MLFTLLAQNIFSAPFDDESSTSLSGSVELTALDAITTTVMPNSTDKGGKISEDDFDLTPLSKMLIKITNPKCFNQGLVM